MPTLLFLAGLQAIPEDLLEAAAIDGRGTLPPFLAGDPSVPYAGPQRSNGTYRKKRAYGF
jgi:hypothetical protein